MHGINKYVSLWGQRWIEAKQVYRYRVMASKYPVNQHIAIEENMFIFNRKLFLSKLENPL